MLPRGTEVAGYRVERLIGRGGMGAVYEATQLSLSRPVALKLLAPHLGEDPVFRERFRREGVIQAALDHPHIVPIYEAGESEHGLFLAMRLVRGANLKDLIASGTLDSRRAVGVLRQAAGALDAAHAAGLVHRDVKPQNVLVAEGDYTYLADFGLTKAPGEGGLTASGQQVGSLDYISPEQIRGEQVTPRSDLYAFGVVLYEALAGAVPYQRDSDAALMYAHLEQEPPPLSGRRPDVPATVDAAVARALAKDPAERPASATALVDDVEEALAGVPVGAPAAAAAPVHSPTVVDIPMRRPVTPTPVSAPARRDRRWALAAIGAAALALAGGALGGRASGEVTSVPAQRAAGVGFDVLVPHGWTVRPGAQPGFPLAGAKSLGLPGRKPAITIGTASSQHPSLLPASVRRALKPVPAPKLVALGRLAAYHYDRLTAGLSAYLVPTTDGVLAVVCPRAAAADCAGVAASVRLKGSEPYRPGPAPATAKALDAAISTLAKTRGTAARELGAAKKSAAQSAAASRAVAAYAGAAKAVSRIAAKPFERPAFGRLAKELRSASAAWKRLAAAARQENVEDYREATAAVTAAEKRAANAVRSLAAYGYPAKA